MTVENARIEFNVTRRTTFSFDVTRTEEAEANVTRLTEKDWDVTNYHEELNIGSGSAAFVLGGRRRARRN